MNTTTTPVLPEPGEVRELIDTLCALPSVRHQRERLDRLVEDYARGRSTERAALIVALIGATGAGKSTLLNALAASRIAIEGVDRPTSRAPVVYAPEDAPLGKLESLGARIERYVPQRTAQGWSGQIFVDTPDLNSVETSHRAITRAVLEQADVAVVVLHRGSVAEAVQIDFLAEFARRRRVVFVLNFADELGPTAREELKAQARRIAREQFGLTDDDAQIFAVSALHARRGDGEAFDYDALLAALRALGERATVERIRASNASSTLRELGERANAATTELQALREAVVKELDAGFTSTHERLSEDFAGRLEAAHVHLAQEVRARAAGRWWGPAALWMRLSALGAGGLGAAALVGRFNLPAGIAVAAASTALNAVQDRTRAKAAEGRVVGANEGEDATVANVARAALASARHRAISAGLSPEQLGLPEVAALLTALTSLRAACFAYAQSEAISHSVASWWRWARWILQPLVNLPLLALGGHVGYVVVRGYLSGEYISSSYFLNALALAAMLSVGGALLASASLAGVARRARSLADKRFDAGLEQLAQTSTQAVQDALPEVRAAAARLASVAQR